MKKSICLVLIFVLMLTACSKWEVEIVDPTKPVETEGEESSSASETESEPEVSSAPETEEQPEKFPERNPAFVFEKPEILYPENAPEELFESVAFAEAMNRPSVILYDYEPISDCLAAVNFIEAFEKGEYAELYIFRFTNIDYYSTKDASCTCLFTENGAITETAEDWKDWETCSNYGYIKLIKNVYINDYGFFTVESEIYEPVYYKVISDFALYENEAEHRAMKEKYIDPIFTITVSPKEFASVSDFSAAELVFLFEDIYNHENGNDPWQKFGNNWPLSEILSLLNRYFEGVTKEMIISDSRFAYDPETDSIFYEGGRGGVPPDRRVFDYEQNGDILTVYYWLYHEESGTIYDDKYYALSIRLLPDGSFCYLSQEILENGG